MLVRRMNPRKSLSEIIADLDNTSRVESGATSNFLPGAVAAHK
jgi:hypothetical protein